MSGAEVVALKETLHAQQELLQQLQNELDAEREASATAASEALSVILRLQGEKAAVKMEAEQYKRLAEERMCHAEESFAVVEDIIEERDMQVAALDYQIQTCRDKLLSMGWDDDMESPPAILGRNMRNNHKLPRRNSEPVLLKFMDATSCGQSPTPEAVRVPRNADEVAGTGLPKEVCFDLEKKVDTSGCEGIDDYSDKKKKLNNRVRQITAENSRMTGSPPLPPRKSSSNLKVLNDTSLVDEVERMNRLKSSLKEPEAVNFRCSPGIFDVFEVPQVHESCRPGKSQTPDPSLTDDKKRKACQDGKICEAKGDAQPEAADHFTKGENDWLKKLLENTHDERHLCRPSEIAAIERAVVTPPTISCAESESNMSHVNRNSETETVTESKSCLDRVSGSLVTNKDLSKSDSSSSQVNRNSETDETVTKSESSFNQIDKSLVMNDDVIEGELSLDMNEHDTESESSLNHINRSSMKNEPLTNPESSSNKINWGSVTKQSVTESESCLNHINNSLIGREPINESDSNVNQINSSSVTNEAVIYSETSFNHGNMSSVTTEAATGPEPTLSQIDPSYVTNESLTESELPLSHPSVDSVINENEMPAEFISRTEQLKLLKKINNRLNLLHAEISSQENEESSMLDQISLPLPEAMLYFWL